MAHKGDIIFDLISVTQGAGLDVLGYTSASPKRNEEMVPTGFLLGSNIYR